MKGYLKVNVSMVIILFLLSFPQLISAQITFEKVYPSFYDKSSYDVLPTSDGGYIIIGHTTNDLVNDWDIYLFKINSTGDVMWSKSYGGKRPELPYHLIETKDGNYFIIGYSQSFGGGDYDIYLLKVNPSGDTLWTKTYGGWGNEEGRDIVATADGNYMITGFSNSDTYPNYQAFLMKIDPDGNEIWTEYYGGADRDLGNSVKQCDDGGYVFVGQTRSYGVGGGDVYLVKTNSSGDTSWTKTFGGSQDDEGVYILENSDGSFTFCVRDSSAGQDVDIHIIKTDGNGNKIWDKMYGGDKKDTGKMIQHTSDGGYIVCGHSRSFGWINPEMWILKLDELGDTLWTRRYGGWDHEHLNAIRQTDDGGYIAVGHTESSSTINEIMVLKLNQIGELGTFVALNELGSGNSITLYPNPSDGTVWIKAEEISSPYTIKIQNTLGEIVFMGMIDSFNDQGYEVDLQNQPAGIYFLALFSGDSSLPSVSKKFIIK